MTSVHRTLFLFVIGLTAGGIPLSSHAEDILLCIDEVPGESQVTAPANCIDIQSWNWSAAIASSGQVGSGRTRSRAEVAPLVIFKETDRSTPDLMLAVLQSKVFAAMKLIVRTCPAGCDKEAVPLVTITLENVFVVSFDLGSTAGTRPTDSFGFEFEQFEYCYQPFDTNGQPLREICKSFDLEAGA